MGRPAKSIALTLSQRSELEKGYKTGSAIFSRRCHMILLKSESRSSLEVATLLNTNQISVNKWLRRYEEEGIDGLQTKAGQGRKPILAGSKDEQKVRQAIVDERQRLKYAKH